jgi:hypothetical protein
MNGSSPYEIYNAVHSNKIKTDISIHNSKVTNNQRRHTTKVKPKSQSKPVKHPNPAISEKPATHRTGPKQIKDFKTKTKK